MDKAPTMEDYSKIEKIGEGILIIMIWIRRKKELNVQSMLTRVIILQGIGNVWRYH